MTGLTKVLCPYCGHQVEMTVREFQTSPNMRCSACSSVSDFAPDRRKIGGGKPGVRKVR